MRGRAGCWAQLVRHRFKRFSSTFVPCILVSAPFLISMRSDCRRTESHIVSDGDGEVIKRYCLLLLLFPLKTRHHPLRFVRVGEEAEDHGCGS